MAHIGIISTNRDMIDIAREVSFETGHELVVKLGIPNDKAAEKARILQDEYKVDAIIAPGAIYEIIRNATDVPTICMELTNYELVKALHQAYALSTKVAFVEFKRITRKYDLDSVKRSFSYDFDIITMNGTDEVDTVVATILKKGYEVVVTAARCILGAIPPELYGIELVTRKPDLLEAISLATQSIETVTREKEKSRWMQTVVDNIQEGILILDKTGLIKTFNVAAEEITGIAARNLVGLNIKAVLKSPIINSIYGDGNSTENEMTGKLIINRIPIYDGMEQSGLVIKIQRVTQIQELEQEIRKELLSKGFIAKATFADIIENSPIMKEIKTTAQKYAASSSNIIIYGESGAGKELFAQSIHNASSYRKGPFVAVNCAALSESLLESELFGYEEGAFTGAKKGGKPGLFELAHNGTIFLDEIGDMPHSLQSRLLRVIQEREVIRLGGNRVIPVNNRIICATNKDLVQETEKGLFRQDLYYRINILQLQIPPLRERPEDIPVITHAIFKKKCKETQKHIQIQPAFLNILKEYPWPGNTREIEAFTERLLSITEGPEVEYSDFINCFNNLRGKRKLPTTLNGQQSLSHLESGKLLINLATMDEMETEIIEHVFSYVKGDKEKVEKILGISRTTLWRKMKRINFPLETPETIQATSH